MCNLYHARRSSTEIANSFGARDAANVPAQDYTAPTTAKTAKYGLVVTNREGRQVEAMEWGMRRDMKSEKTGKPLIQFVVNVRNLASPFWRSTIASPSQRCLVPVEDFAEWNAAAKTQAWFSVPSREMFAFAGIWRMEERGPRYAFLTCEPNPLVGAIHPKAMPVILHEEDYGRWLAGHPAEELAVPYPSQLMAMA